MCNDVLMQKTGENKDLMRAMQELRRSSAASKHRNLKKYTRKVKHKGKSDA